MEMIATKTPRPINAPWKNNAMRRPRLPGPGCRRLTWRAIHREAAQASKRPRVLVTHRSAISRYSYSRDARFHDGDPVILWYAPINVSRMHNEPIFPDR